MSNLEKDTNKKLIMEKFIAETSEALKKSAQSARKTAKQTNTPLVIYDKEKGIQEVYITD